MFCLSKLWRIIDGRVCFFYQFVFKKSLTKSGTHWKPTQTSSELWFVILHTYKIRLHFETANNYTKHQQDCKESMFTRNCIDNLHKIQSSKVFLFIVPLQLEVTCYRQPCSINNCILKQKTWFRKGRCVKIKTTESYPVAILNVYMWN